MRNELLLLLSVVLLYGGLLLFYYFLGRQGVFCWTVMATIAANIEVLVVVRAFGMEQTLGNVMFASTFLATDILSETASKQQANRAVNLGIFTSVAFVLISQLWLLYVPAASDWAMPAVRTLFSHTPRVMASSLLVNVVCQKLDVWLYHRIWELTSRLCGDRRRFLWLRNNAATMVSQAVNSVLFTLASFAGVYNGETLVSIIVSGLVLFFFTSLLDTPVLYLARRITPRVAEA